MQMHGSDNHTISLPPPPPPPPPVSPSVLPRIDINYDMLLKGHIETLRACATSKLSDLRTQDNSTILHVAASFGGVIIIYEILKRDREILYCKNSEGDLPIHAAVRACQLEAVKALVDLEETLLGDNAVDNQMKTKNGEGNTALHLALENREEKIAEFLFRKCPSTFCQINSTGTCPLYLALKHQYRKLAQEMMLQGEGNEEEVENTLMQSPKSVVHAALSTRNLEIVKEVIAKFGNLATSIDDKGRTTMAYAAQLGFVEGIQCLSVAAPQLLFQPDNGGLFPIHWACIGGNIAAIKELSISNDMVMLLTNQRQNILHLAARNGRVNAVSFLLGKAEFGSLINAKDRDGNTPLHLAVLGKHPRVVYALASDPRIKLMLLNKQGFTAFDCSIKVVQPSFRERLTWAALKYSNAPRSAPPEDQLPQLTDQEDGNNNIHKSTANYKDRINALQTLCTFMAAAAFASNFTIPGGNSESGGKAALAKKHAFQIFVLSNTIAFYSSIFAAVNLIWAHLKDVKLSVVALKLALPSLGVAFVTLSISSTTGLFVVLQHNCNWLAGFVIAMGAISILLLVSFFIPLYSPLRCVQNKVTRRVFDCGFRFMLIAYDCMD